MMIIMLEWCGMFGIKREDANAWVSSGTGSRSNFKKKLSRRYQNQQVQDPGFGFHQFKFRTMCWSAFVVVFGQAISSVGCHFRSSTFQITLESSVHYPTAGIEIIWLFQLFCFTIINWRWPFHSHVFHHLQIFLLQNVRSNHALWRKGPWEQ